jgi:flagellar basal body P-ring protein FlgI
MTINSQQIHNVLRTYGKQLRRGIKINRIKQMESSESSDKIQISPEAKRKMVIEKVAAEILLGMTANVDTYQDARKELTDAISQEYGRSLDFEFDTSEGRFQFNVMDSAGENKLSVVQGEEADALSGRLIELAKEMVDRTMVKG